MHVLFALAVGCAEPPVGSEPVPTPDPFEGCEPHDPILGMACERGYDCMVVCDCGDAQPVAAGNCAGNLCERPRDACEPGCESVAGVFTGRTCAVGDTGLWPQGFSYVEE